MEKEQHDRKIILTLAISLDGYIEGPNGETDWLTFSEEAGNVLQQFLEEIDTMLYGRISYEKWGNYIPGDDRSNFEKNFYKKTNKMAKYVFSTSQKKFAGNPKVVKSDVKQTIDRLKRQRGKNIWLYGGAELISTFLNLDLIDEIKLAIHPVILGAGKPLFSNIQNRVGLKLNGAIASDSGVIQLDYEAIRQI